MPGAGTDPELSRCGYGTAQEALNPRSETAGTLTAATTPPRRPHRLADTQKDARDLTAEMKPDTATKRLLFQHNMTTDTAPCGQSAARRARLASR